MIYDPNDLHGGTARAKDGPSSCPMCDAHPGEPFCLEQGPSKFNCTRVKGHSGKHCACGETDHGIEVWE